jgi:hypothetical protein
VTGPAFETFLARLYADEEALARFLADPRGEASRGGLSEHEVGSLAGLEPAALRLAARCFADKRAHAQAPRRRAWWRFWG